MRSPLIRAFAFFFHDINYMPAPDSGFRLSATSNVSSQIMLLTLILGSIFFSETLTLIRGSDFGRLIPHDGSNFWICIQNDGNESLHFYLGLTNKKRKATGSISWAQWFFILEQSFSRLVFFVIASPWLGRLKDCLQEPNVNRKLVMLLHRLFLEVAQQRTSKPKKQSS